MIPNIKRTCRPITGRLILSMLLLGAICCGKKSAPRPPEDYAPLPVQAIYGEGKVNGIMLSWLTPPDDGSDSRAQEIPLDHFVIRRALYIKGETPDFDEIGNVAVAKAAEPGKDEPGKVEPVKENKKTEEQQKPSRYTYLDITVEAGKQYEYLVVPTNEDDLVGEPIVRLRATFLGESSTFELLPVIRRR